MEVMLIECHDCWGDGIVYVWADGEDQPEQCMTCQGEGFVP